MPAPVVDPTRGDQPAFIDADPALARDRAGSGREWWLRLEHPAVGGGVYRGAEGAVPVGLELADDADVTGRWSPRTRQQQIYCGTTLTPTGRTSADVEPLDLAALERGRWGALEMNYPEVIRLAQHFNAGDLVEVRYRGVGNYTSTMWVHPEMMLVPTARAPVAGLRSGKALGAVQGP